MEENAACSTRKRTHHDYVNDALQQASEITNTLHSDSSAPQFSTTISNQIAGNTEQRRAKDTPIYATDRNLQPVSRRVNGRIVATPAEQPSEQFQDKCVLICEQDGVASPERRREEKDFHFLRPPRPHTRIIDKTLPSESYVNDANPRASMTQQRYYAPSGTSVPVRSVSRSSAFGHHGINLVTQHPTAADYKQPSKNTFAASTPAIPRTFKAPVPKSAMPSPFYRGQFTPYSSFARAVGPTPAVASRPGTAAMDFQVQPVEPRRMAGASLNSLSFMHNPYTSYNQPILHSATRKYPTALHAPFPTPAIVGNIKGAKASGQRPPVYSHRPETSYRMNVYSSRYPEPSRGLFSSAGRRTVRR